MVFELGFNEISDRFLSALRFSFHIIDISSKLFVFSQYIRN